MQASRGSVGGAAPQPASWAELCQGYRSAYGSASYATVHDAGAVIEQRFARSVPTMCPLSETRHPLFASGEAPHQPNQADGSLHRANRHGWGDVTLLKQDGPPGALYRSAAPERPGRAAPPPQAGRDGRGSLFGTLSGAEAGSADAWLGNPLVDPAKGRRAATAPRDPKGRRGLAEVLSLASPGKPEEDAWLGCVGIDPARGRGHPANPAAARGRANLFGVLQPGRPVGAWEAGAAGGGGAECDAWVGNRGIAPKTGKLAVSPSDVAAAQAHLSGATFRGGPPPGGCWSDLPRVGRRPLPDPVQATGALRAAHALRQEDPLPPGMRLPGCELRGKLVRGESPRRPGASDGGGGDGGDGGPRGSAEGGGAAGGTWDDAAHTSRRGRPAALPGAVAAGGAGLLDWRPNRAARFVPRGGLAQERGMNLDTISRIAAITRKGGGTMVRPAAGKAGKGGGGGGAR
ncbi:MAG: hypothetical protein J3K34DRAFT_500556 [Monoraphidium minutum]|nr:MAG: hypothetical protein J3K34DRAFT_500556 [Monoraphidium minutum]